ncbi:hypothetical protein ACFYUV_27835 [Nonomuraea sp. NPDC003560]|uniref:hypothetical protein n=1 Tax=Nonomuraea sp. NPDC003560 TaxID=3364341 RepID=UPI00367CC32A
MDVSIGPSRVTRWRSTPDLVGEARVQDLSHAMPLLANSAFTLLVVAFLAANLSFFLTTKTIELANAISTALLTQDFDTERAANSIRALIIPPEGMQIFYILLELVAIILLVLLLIAFIFRAAMTTLLVVAAPLAPACLALPQWKD